MKVPCPLPLFSPWSPVGYQIVEVGEPSPPASQSAAPRALPADKKKHREAPRVAWSPVGCRVVQVAEVRVPPPRRRTPIVNPRPIAFVPPRRPETGVSFGACAAGGIFLLLIMGVALASLTSGPRSTPRSDFVWSGPAAIEPAPCVTPRQIVLPESAAKLPVRDKTKPPAATVNNDCGLDGKETFGTTVEFTRNPLEATRLASKANKLAFILHVSGNFEESRFT